MGQVFGCVQVKESTVAIKESFGKTKDNVFVCVVACIQYRGLVEKSANAFYKRAQLRLYVLDAIRASVPKMDLDSVFEQQNEIAKTVERELGKAMSAYGHELVQIHIVNIKPDELVKKSMNEMNADRQRQAAMLHGLRDSVLAFSKNVPGKASKDIADKVLVTQFLTQ